MTDSNHSTVLKFPKRTIPRDRRNGLRDYRTTPPGTVSLGEARARLRPDRIVYVAMLRSVCVAHGIRWEA